MSTSWKTQRILTSLQAFLLAGAVMLAGTYDADAGNRGGGRGGGGGARMAESSVSGANHSAKQSGAAARPGSSASSNQVNSGNRANTSTASRSSVNTGNVGNQVTAANVSTGGNNRVNTGDINIDNSVNIDVDGGYPGGYYRHPVAAGAYIGAVAVTTAAVVGSYYHALPPSGCVVIVKNGVSYHQCGSAYYQKSWSGDDVVYVVVNP